MLPASVRPRALASLFGAVLLASACGNVVHPAAAVVGGASITDGRLRATIPALRFLASLQQVRCGQAGSGEGASSACARFALSELIQGQAARSYAELHRVRLRPGELANALTSIEQRFGGHAQLVGELRKAHVSLRQLSDLVSTLLTVERVATAVTSQVLSTQELQRRYRQEQLQFTVLHVAHILVHEKSLAEQIARRVTPANFAELAARYSVDPGSAQKGGDLGTFKAVGSGFDPTFVQAALSLRPGQIGSPVKTRFGWHVIWLRSEDVIPFDQARPQLLAELAPEGFTRWLAHDAGSIVVNPRYGRFDPASGRVALVCSTSASEPCPSASPAPSP